MKKLLLILAAALAASQPSAGENAPPDEANRYLVP